MLGRFTVRFWRMPTEMIKKTTTRAQAKNQAFKEQNFDGRTKSYEKYLGVIYLHLNDVDGTKVDIRKIGIDGHCLKLIENPSWAVEGPQDDLVRANNRILSQRKRTGIPVYHDLRSREDLTIAHEHSKLWIEVTVPQDKVGLIAGKAFTKKIALEDAAHDRPNV